MDGIIKLDYEHNYMDHVANSKINFEKKFVTVKEGKLFQNESQIRGHGSY